MNSRNSVNETNLVNFSAELSSLNQLDAKDRLLSFPFDHIYACHSQSSDRRQPLQLEKEVEVSAHCVVGEEKSISTSGTEVSRLSEQLSAAETQNKKLKDLLIYHLDLIQQQNELITKRDKLYQALKQENDNLKAKLSRADRKIGLSQRHTINPQNKPTCTVTSATIVKNEPSTSEVMLNSFSDLLKSDKGSSFVYDKNKPFPETFGIAATPCNREAVEAAELNIPPLVDPTVKSNNKMLENKRSNTKKGPKTESRSEALYTVTSNSGNPVIQRIQRNRRRTTTGIGSLSRMSRTPKAAIPATVTSQSLEQGESFDSSYSVNKKSKMINTYGKSRSSSATKKVNQYTGSLSDRLRLIDTTPTGDDPYQLGEADMREQSPIPKLMLQKTNHGRMKICSEGSDGRKIYDQPEPKKRFVSPYDEIKKEPVNTTNTQNTVTTETTQTAATIDTTETIDAIDTIEAIDTIDNIDTIEATDTNTSDIISNLDEILENTDNTEIVTEPDLDLVKTEPEIDWRIYGNNQEDSVSLGDISYCDSSSNLASFLPSLDATEFQELFSSDSILNLDSLNELEMEPPEKIIPEKTKKRAARTTSLMNPGDDEETVETKRGNESRRGRKRALSATGVGKTPKAPPKPRASRGRGGAARGKKSPVPGMMTNKPYHTLCGDPDMSWYLGLDPQLKLEDIDPPADAQMSTVEVPRWREKPYTSSYTLEGTEDVDDKVFEKRHQKLEAEERRQLRWHMRRIREQRHVERLRQRQRDSWCAQSNAPPVYTVWPTPQNDVKFIEITDTLPVMAFGEPVPDLPNSEFMLPWVCTSKAQKRSKRSKTLH